MHIICEFQSISCQEIKKVQFIDMHILLDNAIHLPVISADPLLLSPPYPMLQ